MRFTTAMVRDEQPPHHKAATKRDALAKVRDPLYLAEIKGRMEADPIGRANVPPAVVAALIDELQTARESNRHNLAVAREALKDGRCGSGLYVD